MRSAFTSRKAYRLVYFYINIIVIAMIIIIMNPFFFYSAISIALIS